MHWLCAQNQSWFFTNTNFPEFFTIPRNWNASFQPQVQLATNVVKQKLKIVIQHWVVISYNELLMQGTICSVIYLFYSTFVVLETLFHEVSVGLFLKQTLIFAFERIYVFQLPTSCCTVNTAKQHCCWTFVYPAVDVVSMMCAHTNVPVGTTACVTCIATMETYVARHSATTPLYQSSLVGVATFKFRSKSK